VAVISLIVDGTTDELGSLTGKLGMLKGVQICSSLVRGRKRAAGRPLPGVRGE
jgi:hypothetical protein